MNPITTIHRARLLFSMFIFTAIMSAEATAEPPKMGDVAADFELKTLKDETIKLSDLTKEGSVVILVLRGYPEYQCPLCNRQVDDFLKHADKFAESKTQIVMIYPGAADQLAVHATEFLRSRTIPKNVRFVVDPDYQFVEAYRIRWKAPKETAYPSTFLVDAKNVIRYAKVSMTHGGRSKASEILEVLP